MRRKRNQAHVAMMNDRETRLAMQIIGFAGVAVLCAGLFVEQVLLR